MEGVTDKHILKTRNEECLALVYKMFPQIPERCFKEAVIYSVIKEGNVFTCNMKFVNVHTDCNKALDAYSKFY
jgi:hypothetical protein